MTQGSTSVETHSHRTHGQTRTITRANQELLPRFACEICGLKIQTSAGRINNKEESDWTLAARAIDAIKGAILALENSAFSHRKASPGNPFLSELIIPFGASGYVALFEIEDDKTVIILALRLQREEDYH